MIFLFHDFNQAKKINYPFSGQFSLTIIRLINLKTTTTTKDVKGMPEHLRLRKSNTSYTGLKSIIQIQNITPQSWCFVSCGLWLYCHLCLLQPSDVLWPDFDLAHRWQSHKISHTSLDALCCMACGSSVVCVCCSRVTFHGLTLISHAELFHKSLDAFLLHGLWLWWPVSPVCVCSGLSGYWTLWRRRTMTLCFDIIIPAFCNQARLLFQPAVYCATWLTCSLFFRVWQLCKYMLATRNTSVFVSCPIVEIILLSLNLRL